MIRITSSLLIVAALTGMPAAAQQRTPQEAAKAFSLDPGALPTDPAPVPSPAGDGTTAPAAAAPDPASPADAPIVTTLGPAPSLDTPIEQLIANPRTKAVLDADLPGLSTDENLAHFQSKSLRQFQPLTGGQLTTTLLAKVGADLAALEQGATSTLAPIAPAKQPRRRSQDEGR